MPHEQPTSPYPPQPQEQSPPETFAQLLEQKPDMHPGLVPHVQRLAAAERAASNTEPAPEEDPIPESPLKHLTKDLMEYSQNAREGFYASFGRYSPQLETFRVLSGEDYSPEALRTYIREARTFCDEIARSRSGSDRIAPDYSGLYEALGHVPRDDLRRLYDAEWHDPSQGRELHTVLRRANSRDDVSRALKLVSKVWGYRDILDLAMPNSLGSPSLYDPTVRFLLRKDLTPSVLADTLRGDYYLWPAEASPAMKSLARRDWAARYLHGVAGLPPKLSKELQFAAHSRTLQNNSTYADPLELADMINAVARRTRDATPEELERLREKTGITNLDYYAPLQLNTMQRLIEGDPDLIEHLQAGDVTVVMSDAMGDHNGAMRTNSEIFATPNGRTLFFEVHENSDFYRHMSLLQSYGIKPSTVVVAAHGEAGFMRIGKSHDKRKLTNADSDAYDPDYQDYTYGWKASRRASLAGAKGLARMVDEYMQDSRGIDDNPEAKGRRRIVLKSCSQARRLPVERLAAPGKAERILRLLPLYKAFSRAFPVTEYIKESTAGTLAKTINNPNVDIYATAGSTAMMPTDNGAEARRVIKDQSGRTQVKPYLASHIQLDADGVVLHTYTHEIVLRRSNPKKNEAYSNV